VPSQPGRVARGAGAMSDTATVTSGGSVALGGTAVRRRPARAPRPAIVTSQRAAWVALGTLLALTAVTVLFSGRTLLLAPQSLQPLTARPALAGPLSGLGPDIHLGGLIALFTLITISYFTVVRLGAELPGRVIIGAVIAVHVLMAFGPPLLSTDVFSYTAYGRMSALYNINPYTHGPGAIRFDHIQPLVGALWVGTPSAYGPLFTALSYPLAGLSIAATALSYKLIAVVCSLLAIAGVARASECLGRDAIRAVTLVGLNPVLVIYAVGGAHNDLIMLAAMAWSIVAFVGHRGRTAGGLLVAGLAVKLTAGIMLPFMLAARREPARPHQGRVLAGAISVLLGVVIVSTVLFGSGPLHLLNTLELIQANGGAQSIPGFIAAHLGFGRLSHGVVIGFEALLVAVIIALLVAVRRRRMDWITATGWAIVALLVTSTYLLPWYVIWLLPFAALSNSRGLRYACLAFTAIGMTSL
jgi:hypothetical protein